MITKAMVERSFKHGDAFVIQVGDKIYVSEECLKHPKYGIIEFVGCQEVDDTCLANDGEYYGDTLPKSHRIILQDHLADSPNSVETVYYEDEITCMYDEKF